VTSAPDPSRPRSVTSPFHSHTPRIQSKPKTLSRQKSNSVQVKGGKLKLNPKQPKYVRILQRWRGVGRAGTKLPGPQYDACVIIFSRSALAGVVRKNCSTQSRTYCRRTCDFVTTFDYRTLWALQPSTQSQRPQTTLTLYYSVYHQGIPYTATTVIHRWPYNMLSSSRRQMAAGTISALLRGVVFRNNE
jgi:hypothetical protein